MINIETETKNVFKLTKAKKQNVRRTWTAIFVDKFKKFLIESDYSDFDFKDFEEYNRCKKLVLKKLNNKILKKKAFAIIPYTVYQRYNNIVVFAEHIFNCSFAEFKFDTPDKFVKKHNEYLQKQNRSEVLLPIGTPFYLISPEESLRLIELNKLKKLKRKDKKK